MIDNDYYRVYGYIPVKYAYITLYVYKHGRFETPDRPPADFL